VDGTYDNPLALLESNKHCSSEDLEPVAPRVKGRQRGPAFRSPGIWRPTHANGLYRHLPNACQPTARRARLSFSPAAGTSVQVILATDYPRFSTMDAGLETGVSGRTASASTSPQTDVSEGPESLDSPRSSRAQPSSACARDGRVKSGTSALGWNGRCFKRNARPPRDAPKSWEAHGRVGAGRT
jgi:hypothetical protein